MASRDLLVPDTDPGRGNGRALKWAIWLAATASCAVGLREYRVDSDLSAWAPQLRATGPVRSYLVVGFERNAVDERSLAEGLCRLSSVEFCVDPQTVKSSGHLIGVTPDEFVIGPDEDYAGIFLFPRPEIGDEFFVSEIRRVLDSASCDGEECFNLGGPAVFHVALNQASQKRLSYIMPLILFLGATLIWWLTGRFAAAAATTGAIILSQIAFVGTLAWFRVPMDISVSMVPPLMMSLGFSYAAHRALRPNVGRVLSLSAATTALGFATFAFVNVPSIRMFAFSGVWGLALVWLAIMTLVPGPGCRTRENSRWVRTSPLLQNFLNMPARHTSVVVTVALAICASAILCVPKLRFETDPLTYFPRTDRLVVDMTTLNERLTGMLSVQWSVNGSADPTPLITNAPGVRKLIDITSIARDGRLHLWCLADNGALPSLIRLNESLQAWASDEEVDIQWHGVAAQLAEVSRILTKAAAVSLPTMGLVVGAAVGLQCHSVLLGFVSIWVNLFPVCALLLIVAIFGSTLDLPSLMIGAIAVGMAVDDTLHIASCSKWTNTVFQSVEECFRPSAGSSFVVAACLACFAISPFSPIRQFGMLLAIAAIAALLANLLLLPALWPKSTTTSSMADGALE